MKKYDLSKIMKRAWELVKGFGYVCGRYDEVDAQNKEYIG